MSYSFRFTFPKSLISSDVSIENKESKQILLIETPYSVTLSSHKQDVSISDSDLLVVQGKGYDSAAVAKTEGHRIKDALMLTFAKHSVGVDFSMKNGTVMKEPLKTLENSIGKKAFYQWDGYVLVFEDGHEVPFITVNVNAKAAVPSDMFVKTFTASLTLSPSLSEREQLAYRVFNIALFQPDIIARFLHLIMVTEVLSDYAPRSEEAVAHVEMLIESTKNCHTLKKEDADSMVGALHWLKQESIRQAGKRLVAERLGDLMYASMNATKYFSECYDLRSSLVHGGTHDRKKFNRLASHLPHFVSDLLTVPILGPPSEEKQTHR
jgi:hypothetical protein